MFTLRSNLFFVAGGPIVAFCLSVSLLLGGCANVSPKSATTSPTPPSTPTAPSATPAISLSATSFNFNTVAVGQSATQTLQITNTGNASLTINSLSLQSQQFTITGPTAPVTVPPSQSAAYTISFAPTAAGSASASLQISSNASTTAAVVSLAGIGQSAVVTLQVSPSTISFGNVTLQSSASQTVTLQNTGGASTTISGVTVTGAGFTSANLSSGATLSPNQTVSFQVSFHPTVAGAASGTVSILSSNVSSPVSISLSGDGVSSTPPPTVQHTVTLSWDASTSAGITGYIVYRSTTSGTGFVPLTAALSVLTYADDTVTSGTAYYYVVTALDTAGVESPYSNQVTAVIPSP